MVYKRKTVLTIIGGLMLVLVVVNILLSLGNQSLRMQVGERQQAITQAMQLEAVHREIVTAIATVALKTNDPQLKSLLASHGRRIAARRRERSAGC
jgi:uncharacterized membrane protein YeiB